MKTRLKKRAPSKVKLPKISAAEVRKILAETDWKKFWQDVDKTCAPEIEAYRRAWLRSTGSLL